MFLIPTLIRYYWPRRCQSTHRGGSFHLPCEEWTHNWNYCSSCAPYYIK